MSPTPIVALHGFAGHGDSWAAVASALPDRALVALTLFGHDPEHPASGLIRFEDEVERIASVIRQIGQPVRLCGYSMGARLGLGVLERAPELVRSAVLVGVNPGLATDGERAARAEDDARWSAILDHEGMGSFTTKWQAQALFASQASLPHERLAEQQTIRARHDATSLALSMTSLSLARMPSYWDLLARVTCPVQLVVGSLDVKFTALARRMVALLEHGELLLVEGAGHNVLLERPERLAAILAEETRAQHPSH